MNAYQLALFCIKNKIWLTKQGKNAKQIRDIRANERRMTNARNHAQDQYRLFCERRREAAEQLGELELQKHLEEEIRQIRP